MVREAKSKIVEIAAASAPVWAIFNDSGLEVREPVKLCAIYEDGFWEYLLSDDEVGPVLPCADPNFVRFEFEEERSVKEWQGAKT